MEVNIVFDTIIYIIPSLLCSWRVMGDLNDNVSDANYIPCLPDTQVGSCILCHCSG